MSEPSHDVWRQTPPPSLTGDAVHVWRVSLGSAAAAEKLWPLLSDDEQTRARRFFQERHRRRYIIAHGALRQILASYLDRAAESIAFMCGANGKPSIIESSAYARRLEFNLSHSGDLALVAVAWDRPIGVDLEEWERDMNHLELAERFFSPVEREALRALAPSPDDLVRGFFAAWSRKEAYLKATGHGVTRGLHHFDVTLTPHEPARLVADRRDEGALERWRMVALPPAPEFSGALVVAAPLDEVLLFDRQE
ncbi:MAG TPA: 4'-phosphopantetheinyl transferase superfamily protein [Gemmatimonadaceae bacterium]